MAPPAAPTLGLDAAADALRAIDENDEGLLRDAISRGADLETRLNYRTLLQHAARRGYDGICRVLIAAGAKVDGGYSSPLYQICHSSSQAHEACVRCLVDAGADVNFVTNSPPRRGMRPLHMACERGSSRTVQYLIDHGAEVDGKNLANGCTPLQYAHHWGRRQNLLTMLRAGATLKLAKHAAIVEHSKHKEAVIMLNDYLIDIVNEGGWDARVRRHQGGLLGVVSRCVSPSLPDDVKLSIVSFWSLPH